ncbi:CPBP family intramembrane glutamic endopeptidase [Agromyces mangrovi Wang et al. 2018]|uniref:CPBP family intramembrane glutamic endopeptidase n=1 Tax=Agromyces mangrovi TaxID=1858653 RepID=UPI002574764C|nr:CPBP family intramembrane glutamic endopeptidase [Agromyces mangrovi]BDZ64246.1 hypothetical protein GCM10025877_11840 [Agromyces mangrovi]
MRVKPKSWIGLVVFLAYLILIIGVQLLLGIDYLRLGESESSILNWIVIPLAIGAVFLVVATTFLGWWRPVLVEKQRAPRWLIIPGALLVVASVAIIILRGFEGFTPTMVLYLALGTLLVGFCEELATRGVPIVGFRGSELTETKVWLFSTLLFAGMHLANFFTGAGLGVVLQFFFTFGAGTVYYLVRRSSGSIVWAMLVHALWDFATVGGTDDPLLASLILFGKILAGGLALLFVIIYLSKHKGQKVAQYGGETAPKPAPVG